MEEQIREHERIVIELKRARNALLNISTLPPEVLGNIFQWNVTLKGDFDGLEKGSRNFLFVCHHWSEVAMHTPEVWSFWGNTPTDWTRWHRHPGTTPLDLVLGDATYHNGAYDHGTLDVTVCDTLRDRAARDEIRRVHLRGWNAAFLNSILSPLATPGEGLQPNSVESFILSNNDHTPVDVTDFFACYRFPKLQRLELHQYMITSWDVLMSRTTVLTSLALHSDHPSPPPTTSQLLSIFASNPSLLKVSLSRHAVPVDGGGEPPCRVPLHNLKELMLVGGSRHVIGLLHQLDHPMNLDLNITLCDRTVEDIPRIVGPYLQDHLRRRDRSQGGLGLSIIQLGRCTIFHVGDAGGIDLSTPMWEQIVPSVSITTELVNGSLDLVAHTPRDEVVSFYSWGEPAAMEDISTQFPNLRALHSCSMPLPVVFPELCLDGNERIPPSLQHVFLEGIVVDGGDWSPLTTFLTRRVSSGNRLDSLTVDGPHMCLEVEGHIRSMVREFSSDCPSRGCPFGTCPEE